MGRLEEEVELHVKCMAHSDRAVLVAFEEGRPPVWLPLSQIDLTPEPSGLHLLCLPGWLAAEKEMI